MRAVALANPARVGDVSGKGIGAALLASDFHGMLESELRHESSMKAVAISLNRFFSGQLNGEKYATLILVRLTQEGELEVCNCGHVPLIHF